jgi:hypothetical protein
MERDPYIDSYDNNDMPWASRQEQYQIWAESPRQEQYQTWAESPQQTHYQKIQPVPAISHMSKEESQVLIRRLKQGLLISSIIGFGTLSWFATMQQAASALPQPPIQLQQFGPSNSNGNFFDQGGHSFGEHHHHRRYDFGQGQNSGPNQDQNSGPNQGQGSGPISGTHVS